MCPYVDNVRDFKIAADIPEIVSQMFDRGAPAIICMGFAWTTPGTGIGSDRDGNDLEHPDKG